MPARKNRGTPDNPMQEGWRKKIQASQIINRLFSHIQGEIDMTPTQIKAAEIILRKIEPDLNKTDVQQLDKNGNPADAQVVLQLSDKEIINRYLTSKLGADDGTSKS